MTLGYEYDYKKNNDKMESFQYDTFKALPPGIIQSKYQVYEMTRDTFMTPTNYHNTDWDRKSMIDSIMAVEDAKRKNQQYNLN